MLQQPMGPVDLETGEGIHPEAWELIQDLQADIEDLLRKNAALAGSVTHLQKQQQQVGCGTYCMCSVSKLPLSVFSVF